MAAEMRSAPGWLTVLRRYLVASIGLHLSWEILQLPLYTLWEAGTLRQKVFAIVHCTIGDAMISGLSLTLALVIAARPEWPLLSARRVWVLTVFIGMSYTVYSERRCARGSWAYSQRMPVLPLLGTGVAPLLQWLIVPTLAQRIAIGRIPLSGSR
jgi:predicted anti-sigma-YlaC factor YlaD